MAGLVPGIHVVLHRASLTWTDGASPAMTERGTLLRLAPYIETTRVSYGAVTGSGIVDLGKALAKYPTLVDLFRAGALAEARAAASGPATHQLKDVELLPPVLAPEKIICVGI